MCPLEQSEQGFPIQVYSKDSGIESWAQQSKQCEWFEFLLQQYTFFIYNRT